MAPKKLFTLFAKAEAVTWTLLLAALLLRFFGVDTLVVTIAGGLHGAVFLGYGVTVVLTGINQRWRLRRILIGLILAVIPYATIPFERSLERQKALDGIWRTASSSDPRDSKTIDRLFRWFIARPVVLVALLVIGLTGLFAFLLFLGPPTEWFSN